MFDLSHTLTSASVFSSGFLFLVPISKELQPFKHGTAFLGHPVYFGENVQINKCKHIFLCRYYVAPAESWHGDINVNFIVNLRRI